MSAEKQRFVLYEYLLYFWKKKMMFLIIPPIVVLLTFLGAKLVLDNEKYTGRALVFTGAVNLKGLTNPDNIVAQFPDVKNKLEVFVPEEKYVKFTLKGNDQKSVQQELDRIVTEYNKALQEHSQHRLDTTNTYLNTLDERVKTLNEKIEHYNEKLDSATLTPEQIERTTDLLIVAEDELTETMEKANRIRSDLVFYEKPSVLSESVNPSKTYTKEIIAIGLVLGIFLTFILLVLMKYVFDARRYCQS
ncbi:MAG TPA: lipopolysaccharide biosynthesis protein [Anoxybacillus sp.]|nr:lipopolysaccharide biosynthesis protein [Anoxybacillus sp.]